jgi:hypothetical protein
MQSGVADLQTGQLLSTEKQIVAIVAVKDLLMDTDKAQLNSY